MRGRLASLATAAALVGVLGVWSAPDVRGQPADDEATVSAQVWASRRDQSEAALRRELSRRLTTLPSDGADGG